MIGLKFSRKFIVVVLVILLQVSGAFISGIMPFLINSKFGSVSLSEILYQYSLFVLFYSVLSFGIPEQLQVWRCLGGGRNWLLKNIPYAIFIMLVLPVFIFYFDNISMIFLLMIFCFNYLLIEACSRIINQEGKILSGQFIITLMPVCFWVCSYFLKISPGISLVIITSILGICIAIYCLHVLKKSNNSAISDGILFSMASSSKTYVNRVSLTILDNAPTIVLYAIVDNSSIVVAYAFITRIIMPFSLILQSFVAVFLRENLSNSYSFIQINKYYKYFLLISFCFIIPTIYYLTPVDILKTLDLPIVPISIITLLSLYRFSVLAFNLQNIWNIGNLKYLTILDCLCPVLVFIFIFIFYRFIFPNDYMLFGALSFAVIASEVYFSSKYSIGRIHA
jgi:hypothetical protein